MCIDCPKEKFWKVFSTSHACIIEILAKTIHQLVCEDFWILQFQKNLKIFVYLNILVELNKQFHYNHVDIIAIGSTLDVTISKRHDLIETPIFQGQIFQEIVFKHKRWHLLMRMVFHTIMFCMLILFMVIGLVET
jgi:hypothetical protein